MSVRIFCDFDGTIAVNDVGNLLFTRFGDKEKWWDLVDLWKQHKINGPDLWIKQADQTRIDPIELEKFISEQTIDPDFRSFVNKCEKKLLPLHILSDGMDIYIHKILESNHLDYLDVKANKMTIQSDNSLKLEFPYFKYGCGRCGNCKGSQIRLLKQSGEKTIYIGDGHSDLCALDEADITFAKGALLKHCKERNLSYYAFENFSDIINKLDNIIFEENN